MEKEMLTPHLSVKEFEYSPTASRLGILNKMSSEIKENAKNLAVHIFQPLRMHRGGSIIISSGYRCFALNKKIGGSKGSQHMVGEAMDLPITNQEAKWITDNLNFDQLIYEFPDKSGDAQWIHVSYTTKRKNRKQVLISVKRIDAKTGKEKTVYLPFKGNEELITL